jgi:predicted kinase
MIIQLAGTSGSGKSYVMRKVFEEAGIRTPLWEEGRKQPIGYLMRLRDVKPPVFVPGHYEAPTGGCDTIKDVERIYELVEQHHRAGEHVLFEGLYAMNHTRGPALVRALGKPSPFTIIRLTTELVDCARRINERRREAGNDKALAPKHTSANHTRAVNYASKMQLAGAAFAKASSDDAPALILSLLRSAEATS